MCTWFQAGGEFTSFPAFSLQLTLTFMPRPKKKTPLESSPDSVLESTPPEKEKKTPRRPVFLSVEEKRKWLASILRDTSGQHQGFEISMGDKFKALVEDNKLAGHPGSAEELPAKKNTDDSRHIPELLKALLATVTPPQQQHFSRNKK